MDKSNEQEEKKAVDYMNNPNINNREQKDLISFDKGLQEKSVKKEQMKEVEYTCSDTSAKNKELKELFDRLWTAADELRANSALRSTQYSTPVLGLIFLRYADHKFEEATRKLEKGLARGD